MRALGLGGQVDVDPLDALLGVVRSAAAMVEVYRALVADLALSVGEAVVELPADDEWEMPEVSHRPGIVGFDHLGDPRPHPFVALFNEALDRLARVSKLALDAGVEQRRLKVEQAQAEMVVTAIRATFAHFNVNIDAAELAAFMAAQLRLHEPAALSAPIDAEVVG